MLFLDTCSWYVSIFIFYFEEVKWILGEIDFWFLCSYGAAMFLPFLNRRAGFQTLTFLLDVATMILPISTREGLSWLQKSDMSHFDIASNCLLLCSVVFVSRSHGSGIEWNFRTLLKIFRFHIGGWMKSSLMHHGWSTKSFLTSTILTM